MLTSKQNTRLHWLRLASGCLLSSFYFVTCPSRAATAEKPIVETQAVAEELPTAPLANSPPSPVEDRIRLAQQQKRLLSELKGPPEVVWIDVGGEKVLGFWRPDQSGKSVGAVVLLHAQGQSPRWADSLLRLHEYLPLYGWATFSIELPELPKPHISLRRLKLTPSDETDVTQAPSSKPLDETQIVHQESDPSVPIATAAPDLPLASATFSVADVRITIQQRIKAATQYLHQQGQYNVVLLGEGVSALWALEHLDQADAPYAPSSSDGARKAIVTRAVRAVIMLDLRIPESLSAQELSEHLRHPEVPILDVYTDLGFAARHAAGERKQIGIKAGYETYIQRRLPPSTGVFDTDTETKLTKTLRGFLQKHAQGEALN
jgi:hypothetical protein